MNYLPIFLDLRDRHCLVVGGSETAARKAELLLRAGAHVAVAAPALHAGFEQLPDRQRLTRVADTFSPALLDGKDAVIVVEDDAAAAQIVADAARARHLPVNVADKPALCSFILPSIIDRSPIMVAVSSGGESPVLARLLRARLETLIPAAYGRLSALASRYKARVREAIQPGQRRAFWEKVFLSSVAEMVFSGRDSEAEAQLEAMIKDSAAHEPARGEVYLVGAGPGNPDLLTFRALRLMQQADVVVYDRLVSQPILDMCRRDAERIYVGKERDDHAVPQEEINMMLVRLAKEGKRTLRLKGGDPFIFGRGGEEIETLVEHGVAFQVVPGITAAAGVASYAGIPLTHRDYAQSVAFVTGHLKENTFNMNWEGIARRDQTIVIYMGLKGLPMLCEALIKHGLTADTPAAIVQHGTLPTQRVITGTLATLPTLAVEAGLKAPTLIIVGNVVKLREKLAWYRPQAAGEAAAATPLEAPDHLA
ncbi:uroporphyrin-III C-methyltransferase [Thiobacillus denitrificans ATCC 25259]|uniref:Siroheme synthase n=1 Tax=Thiobacillus denitrificans (strain ATCC 25259 / T1) TaxID=292415 RepID=CYSG_THIDA|nr:siroheme synthase CysG [Thiobacillus denitrificans]Q3SG32.1 RecName: Full=Siroheme synthase; Includes: RecName: Full=Uroporphyrinogen-III C-methyltransferase; Short=Urogen III methylase; AltName: Full=SUMT; AltName: Full=Uroporphyrinogen III methylase; Short=UROM; Includes: RecName: Full=Precorrin-2 dehydrogenase; Includes: RecName: Full=Sirohydrochlorin ferrochelatase [Thiobacillus denitrificans ATCC 25259]AAZ98424.1 uroporphyrin-III C-methyltransferase [Thiobacillus denitrificans ATCC 25259]